MIFIKSDEETIYCIESLAGLEKIYLKKEEEGYKMIFVGTGKFAKPVKSPDFAGVEKFQEIDLGNINVEKAKEKLEKVYKCLYEKMVSNYAMIDITY